MSFCDSDQVNMDLKCSTKPEPNLCPTILSSQGVAVVINIFCAFFELLFAYSRVCFMNPNSFQILKKLSFQPTKLSLFVFIIKKKKCHWWSQIFLWLDFWTRFKRHPGNFKGLNILFQLQKQLSQTITATLWQVSLNNIRDHTMSSAAAQVKCHVS